MLAIDNGQSSTESIHLIKQSAAVSLVDRSEPALGALVFRASFKMHIYRLLLLIFWISSHPPPNTISFLRFSFVYFLCSISDFLSVIAQSLQVL